MKRLTKLLARWRTRRTPTEPTERVVVRRRRPHAAAIVVGISVVSLATVLALAFAPGLRETRAGRAIRFWEPLPPPEPAVAPGQLGVDVDERDAASLGPLTIDPTTAETLGLQTSTVDYRAPDGGVHTTGRVTADERRTTTVTTKVDGWVEQTFGNFEGQEVRQGQPLFTIYSPDLLATQQEYLIALRAERDFKKSEFEVVRASGTSLVTSARRRLELWDVRPQQIAEIERTGKAFRALTMSAPHSGFITERKAFPGTRVTGDMPLYTLADLSVVWVEADVFESDVANVSIGAAAEITLPDGKTRTARVAYVNPMVAPETRTAKVRLELANPGIALKPGMFVDVMLHTVMAPQLVVPRDAVLDTGARKLVLVDAGNNQFVLREIRTGAETLDAYTVLSGLAAGERVARNIQFLVDSETELKQRVDQQFGSSPASGAGTDAPTSAPMPDMPNMPGMSGGRGQK